MLLTISDHQLNAQQKNHFSKKTSLSKDSVRYVYYDYILQKEKIILHGLFEYYLDIQHSDSLKQLYLLNAEFNNGKLNGKYKCGKVKYRLDYENVRPSVTNMKIPLSGTISHIEGSFANNVPVGKWIFTTSKIDNQVYVDTFQVSTIPVENGKINGYIEFHDRTKNLSWNLKTIQGQLSGTSHLFFRDYIDDTCKMYFSDGIPMYIVCKDTVIFTEDDAENYTDIEPDSSIYYYFISRIPSNLKDRELMTALLSSITNFFIHFDYNFQNNGPEFSDETLRIETPNLFKSLFSLPVANVSEADKKFLTNCLHQLYLNQSLLDSALAIFNTLLISQNNIDHSLKVGLLEKYKSTTRDLIHKISALNGKYSAFISKEQWIINMLDDLRQNREFTISHKGTFVDGKIRIPEEIDFSDWKVVLDTLVTFYIREIENLLSEAKNAEKIRKSNDEYHQLVEKIEEVADQIRKILSSDGSFFFSNSITEKYRKAYKELLDLQLSNLVDYSDSNRKLIAIQSLKCLNDILEKLKNTSNLQTLSDNVHNKFHKLEFNPYTNTSITEIQHPRVHKAYREILLPRLIHMLGETATNGNCDEFSDKYQNIETVLKFMLETDDSKMKSYNRKIRRKDNFETLIKKLSLDIR
ncbi:hypothetical protein AT05_01880 [Schleiferia thermophila str. Yellowstone]|nr:hypothetical protein AT05_01880 [Schleiferia thermophila str. Yellowstone]GCD78911.1 hypothetical protein JCM30197_01580 [Schleiferia thermophila]